MLPREPFLEDLIGEKGVLPRGSPAGSNGDPTPSAQATHAPSRWANALGGPNCQKGAYLGPPTPGAQDPTFRGCRQRSERHSQRRERAASVVGNGGKRDTYSMQGCFLLSSYWVQLAMVGWLSRVAADADDRATQRQSFRNLDRSAGKMTKRRRSRQIAGRIARGRASPASHRPAASRQGPSCRASSARTDKFIRQTRNAVGRIFLASSMALSLPGRCAAAQRWLSLRHGASEWRRRTGEPLRPG
jgi:hypothetical protein